MVSKGEKKTLYLAGAAIIGFLLLAQFGYLAQYGVNPFFKTTPSGPINTDTTKDDYYKGIGVFELSCNVWESVDQTTPHYTGTQVNIRWYHFTGSWIPECTMTNASTCYFNGKATDNGYAWIAVEVPTGQAYYVDYALIKSGDPYIVGYQYVDVDADQQKEFVFQYDLKNHAIANNGYPVITFTAYLLIYDASFTGWTFPANITAIGHAQTTKYCDGYLSISAEKKGAALYKYQITLNFTDITKAKLVTCMIPGLGTIDGSQFVQDITDTYTRWTFTIASSFNGADYMVRTVGSANKFYVTQQWLLLPAATDSLLFTNSMYYLVAQTEAGATAAGSNTWMAAGS